MAYNKRLMNTISFLDYYFYQYLWCCVNKLNINLFSLSEIYLNFVLVV